MHQSRLSTMSPLLTAGEPNYNNVLLRMGELTYLDSGKESLIFVRCD
jgi:hypothetical protein